MKLFNTKAIKMLGMTCGAFLLLGNSLSADLHEHKKPLTEYFKECPWLGLIANEINVGPLKISNVSINEGDKLAYAQPGETLNGMLKYRIDTKDLGSLHLHHLTIGIKGQGAQDCVSHNLGVWNSKGRGNFTLKAPEQPGVYEVRFLLTEGMTCEAARDVWNHGDVLPSAAATIGVIIVE